MVVSNIISFLPLFGEMIQFDLHICFRGEVGSTTNQMTVFNISLVCTQLYVGPPCSLASRGPHSPFERQTKLPSQAWLVRKYVTHVTHFFPTKRCTKIQPYQQRSSCFFTTSLVEQTVKLRSFWQTSNRCSSPLMFFLMFLESPPQSLIVPDAVFCV